MTISYKTKHSSPVESDEKFIPATIRYQHTNLCLDLEAYNTGEGDHTGSVSDASQHIPLTRHIRVIDLPRDHKLGISSPYFLKHRCSILEGLHIPGLCCSRHRRLILLSWLCCLSVISRSFEGGNKYIPDFSRVRTRGFDNFQEACWWRMEQSDQVAAW